MTKKQFRELIERHKRESNISLSITYCKKEQEICLSGVKHGSYGLYKPRFVCNFDSSDNDDIKEYHDKKVKAFEKYNKWLEDICEELGVSCISRCFCDV